MIISISSFKHVICISVISRILVFIIQLLANEVLPDHNADAYRNIYHLAFQDNGTQIVDELPSIDRILYRSIEGFTKWDAQYFLEISKDGYVSEQHLAFLPLFPLLISCIRQLLFERKQFGWDIFVLEASKTMHDRIVTRNDLQIYIRSALIGFALNNFVLFPIACLALYALTKLVRGPRERYARDVVWWFCYNPASVFFSASYSESLFSSLTFVALLVIEYRSQEYLLKYKMDKQVGFVPLSQLNRLLHICIPSLIFLALSTGTRSNGIITIGFLGYQHLLKYVSIPKANRNSWTLVMHFSVLMEGVQDMLVTFMSAVLAASGFITFQIYSYIKFCFESGNTPKGVLLIKPKWCDSWLPQPYQEVQSKYWNVGLFRYYQLKQLPNFLLALPMSYLVMVNSLEKSKELARSTDGRKQVPYYVQVVLMTIFCSLSIHVQVTTRILASSSPAVYWICADVAQRTRASERSLKTFFITYFLFGTILHTNFYPWT